jgi:AraC-like DNA-binding protein
LHAHGTTFREELHGARLRMAKKLLLDEVKATAIAARIGFHSVSHFSEWFRGQTGAPPGSWRARIDDTRRSS